MLYLDPWGSLQLERSSCCEPNGLQMYWQVLCHLQQLIGSVFQGRGKEKEEEEGNA